ncbi:MAG: hypothetical protein M3033_19435 [Acidobacteriota bacterium]|nr:hypothetical protein [Acidobacteriota bacterium]
MLPFFLTFAVGLFIASFFVTVAAPSFQFPNRGERRRHQEYDRMREAEIQRLNEKIYQLEKDKSDRETSADFYLDSDGLGVVPPPPPPAPIRSSRR